MDSIPPERGSGTYVFQYDTYSGGVDQDNFGRVFDLN
jgi:hypothetical protein